MVPETSEELNILHAISNIRYFCICTSCVQVMSYLILVAGPLEWLLLSDGTYVRSYEELSLRQRLFGPKPGTVCDYCFAGIRPAVMLPVKALKCMCG